MSIFSDSIDLTEVDQKEWLEKYLGNGYRSCVYMVNHERNGVIVLFGYDKLGSPKVFTCEHKSWIKYRVGYKTKEKDVYGNYVETRYFKNVFDRRKFLDKADGIWIVEAFRPEQEFLMKAFGSISLEPDFNKQPLRTHFLDIETEISEQFESPTTARNRINMITVYDTETEKYWTWSLGQAMVEFHDETDENGNVIWKNPLKEMPKDKFVLRCFQDEASLLDDYLTWHEQNYPAVFSGWNTQAYDLPYIVRRIENVLGEEQAKRLSPVQKYRIKEVNHDNERANVAAEIEVDLNGIFNADGLILYRDKFKIPGSSLDGGFSLDNVGEHEGLGHKIKYKGTLKNLYETDYQKFYEYNVRDVDLVRRIEEKVKMIPLARSITSVGLCNYDSIYTSIGYLIGSLANFSQTEMPEKAVFQSYLNKKVEGESYEGAYVFPPVVGFYEEGEATVDFNSLYPSSIRAVNISPETYVGKITAIKMTEDDEPIDIDDPEVTTYRFKPANGGQVKTVTKEQLKKLIKTKCIFTPNNTLFLKHSVKQGVISAWCRHFFNLRKATKKKMQALEMQLYRKEIPADKIAETEITIQNLDGMQMAIKIMINSIYGVCGTGFSPTYNKELAQTITRMGRFCNQSAAKYIKERFMQDYGVSESYVAQISGDTDSQFINIACITRKMKKEKGLPEKLSEWSDEDKLNLWKFVNDFVEADVNGFVQNLVKEKTGSEHPEVLRYSLEYIADKGIYEAKKHYAVHKILSEGPEIVDKIKYSGIELKKGSIPTQVKKLLEEIYRNTLCGGWKEKDYREYINKAYLEFKKMGIDEISIWKGYKAERQSTGFLQMQKGSTAIASAAQFHNQLLEKLGVGKKYEAIRPGSKVRFCYINESNVYGIKYIAYNDGQWPAEFNQLFEIDYSTMFDKLVMSPLKGYLAATGYQGVDPRDQQLEDIFAF